MKAQMKVAAASLVLAAMLGAAGCAPDAATRVDEGAATRIQSPDVHAFKVGALDVYSLRDGAMTGVPNNNTILGVGLTPADVAAVLTANGLPGDTFGLSIQPLLVRDGSRLVLIDAGGGASMGAIAGKLPTSMRAAGIEPDQVTDVLISHGHGDHIAGLVDATGALTFPNAVIRMSAPEWAAVRAQAQMAALVAAITPKVETFEPGAAISPSITAVPIVGHTPGHSGYEVRSAGQRLLYIADSAHHSVISVQRPDWTVAFDGNPAAMASRQALLARAADENLRLYAVHFPFPGVGRVQLREGTFVWVPES